MLTISKFVEQAVGFYRRHSNMRSSAGGKTVRKDNYFLVLNRPKDGDLRNPIFLRRHIHTPVRLARDIESS